LSYAKFITKPFTMMILASLLISSKPLNKFEFLHKQEFLKISLIQRVREVIAQYNGSSFRKYRNKIQCLHYLKDCMLQPPEMGIRCSDY